MEVLTNVKPIARFFKRFIWSRSGRCYCRIGGAVAQNQIIKDVQEAGKQDFSTIFGQNYQPPAGGLIGQAQRATEFKPFTVTTPTGTGSISSSGGLNLGLTPQQQAMQQQLFGFTSGAFDVLGTPESRLQEQGNVIGMLTQDPMQRATREQDIFGRMQATLQPEQERARLQLEERLANQGRLGVRTAMFGGTPEQLALEKAIAEQQAGLGVSAIEQARAEQALQSRTSLILPNSVSRNYFNRVCFKVNYCPLVYAGERQH
jgi:hypothetical protein